MYALFVCELIKQSASKKYYGNTDFAPVFLSFYCVIFAKNEF